MKKNRVIKFMKESWATPNRVNLLLKFAIRSKKIETNPEKKHKNIQKVKQKYSKIQKMKKQKQLEKLNKN